jgi:hypothetical protein
MPKTPRGKRVVDEATGRFTVVGKAPNGQAQPYFAEGKTKREVVRCLKRYIARRVWCLLEHAPARELPT